MARTPGSGSGWSVNQVPEYQGATCFTRDSGRGHEGTTRAFTPDQDLVSLDQAALGKPASCLRAV